MSHCFGNLQVLDDINLDIDEGKTHVLLGPSGCGKTTLLRLICGLNKVQSGTLCIDSKAVKEFLPAQLAQKIGYVVQNGGLFPHLTAEENILLPVKVHGHNKTNAQALMHDLAEMVHLPKSFLKKYPVQLSGGQKQRVAIMRGLILRAPILLLDEPMSALDPLVRSSLEGDLKSLFKDMGTTVVLVTHHLQEAFYLGDSISLIHKGRIVQTGDKKDFLQNPKTPFVTKFVKAQSEGMT